jgi:tRNA-modifying protein YgfZ
MHVWFELTHLAGIRVTGPDAVAFCQAQLTADFRDLDPGQWQFCAWCDNKGRCLATILACIDENGVELVLPRCQIDLIARLGLYTLGRKVSLSSPTAVAGSFNPKNGSKRLRQDPERALGLVSAPVDPTQQKQWQIADFCNAIAWLSPATSARFLPQFLGLEDNQGVSFAKGCYPGQEVIARVHFLGAVKHQLLGLVIDSNDQQLLNQSARLTTEGLDSAGFLLDSLVLDDRSIGLAVCPIELQPDIEVYLKAPGIEVSAKVTPVNGLCYYRDKIAGK